MITGYNNDIKHRGTVFHVQTEDKGIASAWIESLIYTGGRILARKRVTYKQLLDEGADKPAIAKLMERQHRLMIHQIREGRFDEETSDGPITGAGELEDDPEIHTTRIQQQAEAMFAITEDELPVSDRGDDVSAAEADASREAVAEDAERSAAALDESDWREPEAPSPPPAPSVAAEPAAPAASVPAEPPPPPASPARPEAPAAAASEPALEAPELASTPAPTLDQVIFDYLSSVAQEESLVLLMDESPALASATTTRMDLGTHASRSGKPIANAQIAVRMISKTGGPVTLAEGTTDTEGTLQLVVDVPEVPRDSAALIITAASSIGNAEIKHLL